MLYFVIQISSFKKKVARILIKNITNNVPIVYIIYNCFEYLFESKALYLNCLIRIFATFL